MCHAVKLQWWHGDMLLVNVLKVQGMCTKVLSAPYVFDNRGATAGFGNNKLAVWYQRDDLPAPTLHTFPSDISSASRTTSSKLNRLGVGLIVNKMTQSTTVLRAWMQLDRAATSQRFSKKISYSETKMHLRSVTPWAKSSSVFWFGSGHLYVFCQMAVRRGGSAPLTLAFQICNSLECWGFLDYEDCRAPNPRCVWNLLARWDIFHCFIITQKLIKA